MPTRKVIQKKDVLPFAAAALVIVIAAVVWLYKGRAGQPATPAPAPAPQVSTTPLGQDELQALTLRCRVIQNQRSDDPLFRSYLLAACMNPVPGGCQPRMNGVAASLQDPNSGASRMFTEELGKEGYQRSQFGASELNQARKLVQQVCDATQDFAK